MLFILMAILCVLFVIFHWQNNKNNDYWEKRKVCFVKKTNYFGLLWNFMTENRSLAEIYKDIYEKYESESCVGMFLGSKPTLLIRDPEITQAVFATDFLSFNSRGILTNSNDLLADNILFIDDFIRWRLIRRKVSPVFTSSRLKNMFYIINRCAKDFAEFIKNKNGEETPFDFLYTYTTASIGASIFGIDTQTKNTMDSPFLDMSRQALEPSLKNNLRFFISNTFPSIFKLLRLRIFGEHEPFFIGVVKKVLNERKQSKEVRHDFIDLCVDLQKAGPMKDDNTDDAIEPTDELLAAQAFFFFLAGSDTSANTIHFTLMELSRNRDILEKVHAEIDNIFDNVVEIDYNAIEKLEYLDKVINEALRKYPPIGLIQRVCTRDTVLPVNGLTIEKGMTVVTPVLAYHRDEKVYPEPERFDPNRFESYNEKNRPKYMYMPFGEGNRVCIGARFARLQVKIGLAWVLRKFTLQSDSEMPKRFEPSFFSLRATKIQYKFVERNV